MDLEAFDAVVMRRSERRSRIVNPADPFNHFEQLNIVVFGSGDDDVVVDAGLLHRHADHAGLMPGVQFADAVEHPQVPEADDVSRSAEQRGAVRTETDVHDLCLAVSHFVVLHLTHSGAGLRNQS